MISPLSLSLSLFHWLFLFHYLFLAPSPHFSLTSLCCFSTTLVGLNMLILSHQCNLVRWKKKKNLCLMLLRHGWEWFMTCAKNIFSVDRKSCTDMFVIITYCRLYEHNKIKLFLLGLFFLYIGLAEVRYRSQWLYWSKWTEGGFFIFKFRF